MPLANSRTAVSEQEPGAGGQSGTVTDATPTRGSAGRSRWKPHPAIGARIVDRHRIAAVE